MTQWEYCEIIETINDRGDPLEVTVVFMSGSSQVADAVDELFVVLYEEGWELADTISLVWRIWEEGKLKQPIQDTNKYLFKRPLTR